MVRVKSLIPKKPDPVYGKYDFPQQKRQYHGKTREMYFTKDNFVVDIATNNG